MTQFHLGFGIFIGAGLGALLRWWLSLLFNAVYPNLPMGTLISNLLGCFLAGIVMGVFTLKTTLPSELKLFIVTGFLGGLTTFSTYSLEAVQLFLNHKYLSGIFLISTHLIGSLTLASCGLLGTQGFLRLIHSHS